MESVTGEFPKYPSSWKNEKLNSNWSKIINIRNNVNISIETKRAEKLIGSSLETFVNITLNKDLYNLVKKYDFSEICITSGANLILDEKIEEKIEVEALKAEGDKCSVCWKISKHKCERHGNIQ